LAAGCGGGGAGDDDAKDPGVALMDVAGRQRAEHRRRNRAPNSRCVNPQP